METVAIIAIITIITLPITVYLITKQLAGLSKSHADDLKEIYSVSAKEQQDMQDRLMEMVGVQHWTQQSLDEIKKEQEEALENNTPIEMSEEEEDAEWREFAQQSHDQVEDTGATMADIMAAAGIGDDGLN